MFIKKKSPVQTINQTEEVNKKKRKERSSFLVAYFFVLLFLSMSGYLVYFVSTEEQELINNSYNSRQEILINKNYRGSIYSADGIVLAETIISENGTEQRRYPYGDKFSHVIGYSTRGKTGVESQANYYLINSNIPFTEKVSNEVTDLKNPGDNVYTTLNVALQEAAYKAIDTYKGAIIVTEPASGKILAMVSNPTFDPNTIVEDWDSYVNDEKSSVLLNRATQGLYPPGSTFKIITALQYIRENPENWTDYQFRCSGSFSVGDHKISCYHGTKHGEEDLISSFAKSCNSSFANIGLSLDFDKFEETLSQLLFNKDLPVKFIYSKSHIFSDGTISEAEMMQTAIGQGRTQMTPLHLNMITAAIANNGIMMKPYLIDHVETAEGVLVKSFQSSAYGRIMTEEEALIMKELLTSVVEDGTATKLSGLSYTAAGKTGSAEYNNIKGDSHAWFTGFAPVDNPQICVTIILEGAGSGGDYAVPMAKRVFNAFFNE